MIFSIYEAIFGSAQAFLSTLLLAAFAAATAVIIQYDKGPAQALRLSIVIHGLVYYVAVLLLRVNGYEVGDAPVTEVITLWSSILRLQVAICLTGAVWVERGIEKAKKV